MHPDYLDFAKSLALKAGDTMLEHFTIGVEHTRKEDNTHLTKADTAINKMVIDEVNKSYPGHSVLGEEASHKTPSDYAWVCDPIDGTMNFAFGVPLNVFLLVLCKEGVPQIGVVYDPYMKRLFHAQKDRGAYLGNTRLSVNSDTLERSLIGCSGKRSSTVNSTDVQTDLDKAAHRTARFNCAAYEGLLTSLGQFGGHVYSGDSAHDGVASALFVTEAGGTVTNLLGEQQRYDKPIKGIVASNGVSHDKLVAITKRHSI